MKSNKHDAIRFILNAILAMLIVFGYVALILFIVSCVSGSEHREQLRVCSELYSGKLSGRYCHYVSDGDSHVIHVDDMEHELFKKIVTIAGSQTLANTSKGGVNE